MYGFLIRQQRTGSPFMSSTYKLMTEFRRDDRGAVAVLFGLSVIVLMLVIGVAVDTARFHNVSSKIQDSLDAAALAGAKLLADDTATDSDITARAQAFFDASIASAGVKLSSLDKLDLNIDRINSSVSANLSASVPTLFGGLAFQPKLAVINQTTTVVYEMKHIELSMVLDITGSMNNKNKINDLKSAATDVVDILLKDSISERAVRIAVAPYSASVNAGALAPQVTDVPTTTSCGWSWYAGWSCKTSAGVDADTCVIERQGTNASTDAAPVGSDKLPNVPTLPYGNYTCPSATVIPLLGKSQIDFIKNTINGYRASGATAGHIGTAWGWYLLSPQWASILPPESDPAAYSDAMTEKSMIVMTDGLFNTSYLSGGSTDPATQSQESYARFQELCDGAKSKGITVYTVGFDLSDPIAIANLQQCASAPDAFFDAKTGAQLKKAFKDIANKLATLRVAS
jgi:Flp pilus assembly protein TadG